MDEREKRYVPVIVRFNEEGRLRPILIEFDESHKYPVDKVLDARDALRKLVNEYQLGFKRKE